MENLALALLSTPDAKGLRIGEIDYKLSLYVDDLLLYIT